MVRAVAVRDGREPRPRAIAPERPVEHDAVVAVAVGVPRHHHADGGRRHGDVDELLHLGRRHHLTRRGELHEAHADVERVARAVFDPALAEGAPLGMLLLDRLHHHAHGRHAGVPELQLGVVPDVARRLARELQRGAREREARQVAARRRLGVGVVPVEALPTRLQRQVDLEEERAAADPEPTVVPGLAGAPDERRVDLRAREVRVHRRLRRARRRRRRVRERGRGERHRQPGHHPERRASHPCLPGRIRSPRALRSPSRTDPPCVGESPPCSRRERGGSADDSRPRSAGGAPRALGPPSAGPGASRTLARCRLPPCS